MFDVAGTNGAIRKLETPGDFNERNFAAVDYVDAKGERRPMYQITRDGFSFLATRLLKIDDTCQETTDSVDTDLDTSDLDTVITRTQTLD